MPWLEAILNLLVFCGCLDRNNQLSPQFPHVQEQTGIHEHFIGPREIYIRRSPHHPPTWGGRARPAFPFNSPRLYHPHPRRANSPDERIRHYIVPGDTDSEDDDDIGDPRQDYVQDAQALTPEWLEEDSEVPDAIIVIIDASGNEVRVTPHQR